jgi:hypothetical protein
MLPLMVRRYQERSFHQEGLKMNSNPRIATLSRQLSQAGASYPTEARLDSDEVSEWSQRCRDLELELEYQRTIKYPGYCENCAHRCSESCKTCYHSIGRPPKNMWYK